MLSEWWTEKPLGMRDPCTELNSWWEDTPTKYKKVSNVFKTHWIFLNTQEGLYSWKVCFLKTFDTFLYFVRISSHLVYGSLRASSRDEHVEGDTHFASRLGSLRLPLNKESLLVGLLNKWTSLPALSVIERSE